MQHLNKTIVVISLGLVLFLTGFFVTPAQAQTTGQSNSSQAAASARPACKLSDVNEVNNSWILPDCAYFEGTSLEKECGCRNINVLIQLLIKVTNRVLMVVGGVALLMFIYGGFIILTAAGSSDGIKKGKQALVAATIGLVIIFSAQLLLSFLLDKVVSGEGATVNGIKIDIKENK